jgi:hypothetical protein
MSDEPIISDTARGLPLTAATAGVVSLDLLANKGRFATCRFDDTPLISTFEQPGAEFYCMTCGRYFGFLDPKPATPTPELTAQYEALRARFKAGERFQA